MLLRDAAEVRQAQIELLADPTFGFAALCDYIEDAAGGLAPPPSYDLPASPPPTASSGACTNSGTLAAAPAASNFHANAADCLPDGRSKASATNQGWLPLVGAGLIPVLLRPWNLAGGQ